jgi:hypothetical protein
MGTTTAGETTEVVKASASFSQSFKGGRIYSEIHIETRRYSQDELHEFLYPGQALGTLTAVSRSNECFTKVAAAEIFDDSVTVCFVDDITVVERNGVKVTVGNTVNFTGQVVHSASLHEALLELGAIQTSTVLAEVDNKVLKELRAANQTPSDYLDSLMFDHDKPIEEKVPPGLAPEYWREFVRCLGSARLLGANATDIIDALIHYDETELAARGVSQEAASAVMAHPATKLLREQGQRTSKKLDDLAADMGVSRLGDPRMRFGVVSLDDLADVFKMGVPRPGSRNGSRSPR